jgi:hypothetical protein
MAFEQVGGPAKYYKYKELTKGQVICEGWYTEKGKNVYGHYYVIVDPAGVRHVLNKAGQLDHNMDAINLEDYIRVTYDGKFTLTKGAFKGTDCHQFLLQRDNARCGTRKQVTSSGFEPVAVEETEVEDEDCLPF